MEIKQCTRVAAHLPHSWYPVVAQGYTINNRVHCNGVDTGMNHNDDRITGGNKFSMIPNQMPTPTADEILERERQADNARESVRAAAGAGELPTMAEVQKAIRDGDVGIIEDFIPPPPPSGAVLRGDNWVAVTLQRAIKEGAAEVVEQLTRAYDETRSEKVSSIMNKLPDRYWRIMCDAMDRFAEANAEYGEFAHDDLGLASQWEHMYRKVNKLRSDMWVGIPKLTRETPQEVLQDIIGHCMLALDLYERGFNGGKQ
jgi:hypothetical protein